jgi:hypothetical protein
MNINSRYKNHKKSRITKLYVNACRVEIGYKVMEETEYSVSL